MNNVFHLSFPIQDNYDPNPVAVLGFLMHWFQSNVTISNEANTLFEWKKQDTFGRYKNMLGFQNSGCRFSDTLRKPK